MPLFRIPSLPLLAVLLTGSLSAAAPDWLCADADYRLSATPESAMHASSIDLDKLLLPIRTDNGVKVFADGKPVPFRLRDNGSLAIAPAPGAGEYQIYFGFQTKQPADQWNNEAGNCPPEKPLTLTFFPGSQPCTPEQYSAARRNEYTRRIQWQERYFSLRAYQLFLAQKFSCPVFIAPAEFRAILQETRRTERERFARNRKIRQRAQQQRFPTPPNLQPVNAYARQLSHHLAWHLGYIKAELLKHAAQYRKIDAEAPAALKNELLNIDARRRNWRNDRAATDVQLMIRPPETQEYYTARFAGMLQIPEAGEYEFELFSNALTLVKLDGEEFLSSEGDGSAEGKSFFAKLTLEPGSHPFELLYRVNTGVGRMLFKLRPAGSGDFRVPGLADFEPAYGFRFRKLESRTGKTFPLIARHERYQMFYGKQERVELVRFDFLTPEREVLEFELNGAPAVPGGEFPAFAALPTTGEPVLTFLGKDYAALPVQPTAAPELLVPLQADLALKLWLPAFLYDDEEYSGELELISKLPVPITARLDIAPDTTLTVPHPLARESRTIAIPAKDDERFNRFTQDVVIKQPFKLHGRRLDRPVNSTFKLSIPGFTFQETRVRFLPAHLAGELLFDPVRGALGTPETQTVLLLHRPTLAELRNWELPRKMVNELHHPGKVLILGENFGENPKTLERELSNRLASTGRESEFIGWAPGSAPLAASLPSFWRAIEESDADYALLLLPCFAHTATIEPWERDRCIAAILEKLKSNANIRSIAVSALPSAAGNAQADQERAAALARLAREYDVRYLDPAPYLSISTSDDSGSYRLPDRPGESSRHPVGAASRIAEILVKLL